MKRFEDYLWLNDGRDHAFAESLMRKLFENPELEFGPLHVVGDSR